MLHVIQRRTATRRLDILTVQLIFDVLTGSAMACILLEGIE
ncbi:Uncharacterized protein YR821_0797 [Yersinia ruckeri]|uniref:Uncharacterized protein n=1 Tax=Yersinia ruckeri TaxID=29486 RepID=A0A0A8VGA8_YERRU|nr:Uncharacterized protein YR821_0797 [Yersinia ruckeri]CEK26626.1 hypothetical protein CSF007_4290 [Yersinia ruckeri]